jgi:hypothetical protein
MFGFMALQLASIANRLVNAVFFVMAKSVAVETLIRRTRGRRPAASLLLARLPALSP